MNRITILLPAALAIASCNDDPPFFPFFDSGTDVEADASGDVGGTDTDPADAGDDAADAPAPDALPTDSGTDGPIDDVPVPDVPSEDAPEDAESDASMDTVPDTVDPEPDTPIPDAEPTPCTPGEICDDGGICAFQFEGCGFDPVCVSGCPLEEPVNVCTCGGIVEQQTPACSTAEYTYVLEDVDQRSELAGADCNPDEPGRLRYTANLFFSDMDSFVGGTVYIRVPSNWDDSFDVFEEILVTAGSFDVAVPYALDTDPLRLVLRVVRRWQRQRDL